ncbi:hypothetical protein [Halorhabdus amylolytica]|uniref:hypothetical protein n=1 Tax=Halorhabdus amylolytica TaxID=2559573 RepID=UPI0010A99D63|nr:hypothetical protein [Halorhabdus amylolytica]
MTGHRYHPHVFALVGGITLTLLILSFLVEVRIIVESPDYGDVTSISSTLWQTILGLTTIGSFVLAVYNYRAEIDNSDGPATEFTIRGRNHDIDFHLHVADDERKSDRESQDVESTEQQEAKGESEDSDSQKSS